MENATKALLMAGAVLIAILLIALGMRIFNATSDTTHQTEVSMQTQQVQIFNGQFSGYFSTTAISPSKEIALEQKVKASNAVNKNHQINFTKNSARIYKPHYGNDGYIDKINRYGN